MSILFVILFKKKGELIQKWQLFFWFYFKNVELNVRYESIVVYYAPRVGTPSLLTSTMFDKRVRRRTRKHLWCIRYLYHKCRNTTVSLCVRIRMKLEVSRLEWCQRKKFEFFSYKKVFPSEEAISNLAAAFCIILKKIVLQISCNALKTSHFLTNDSLKMSLKFLSMYKYFFSN